MRQSRFELIPPAPGEIKKEEIEELDELFAELEENEKKLRKAGLRPEKKKKEKLGWD